MFYELLGEYLDLLLKWREYEELYGKEEDRIDLLNKAARSFFGLIQDVLWRDVILHISRLTDPTIVSGRKTVSLALLQKLVDPAIRQTVKSRFEIVESKAKFARDWRNRHIGHRDYKLSLGQGAEPLAPASHANVLEAIHAMADLLNLLEDHYCGSAPIDAMFMAPGDALDLIRVLKSGVEARQKRFKRPMPS